MKNRFFPFLMALMVCISAIALPLTAYAASSDDKTPPTLTAKLEDGRLTVETEDDISGVEAVYIDGRRVSTLVNGKGDVALKDYAGDGKQITVYAVDFAGNRSKEQKFDNPYYKAPANTPAPSPAPNTQGGTTSKPQTTPTPTPAPSPSPSETPSGGGDGTVSAVPDGAFTPDGTGTIQDSATGEEGDKQFYTITTEAGNIFYLIIDGKRDSKNVYFLNTVTEADLMALAEKENGTISAVPEPEKCTCGEKCEAGKVNTSCPVCKNDLTGCTGKAPTPAPEQPDDQKPEKGGGNVGMIVFVLIAMAAVGGAGYYFKIVRPKQQAALDDEDEGFEGDGYGEGYDPGMEQGEETEYLPDDEDNPAQDGK